MRTACARRGSAADRSPGGGPADQPPTRQTSGSRGAPPSRQSAALRPRGPCPQRTCPTRHGTRRGEHGGQDRLAEALVAPCALEGRHYLPETVYRPMIVTLGMVGETEVVVCQSV